MRGDYLGADDVDNQPKVVIWLDKVDFGCIKDHKNSFNGFGIEDTSHQEPMILTMPPNTLLEGILLKEINVRYWACHSNGGYETQAYQYPSRSKLDTFWKKIIGIFIVSWHNWSWSNLLLWKNISAHGFTIKILLKNDRESAREKTNDAGIM